MVKSTLRQGSWLPPTRARFNPLLSVTRKERILHLVVCSLVHGRRAGVGHEATQVEVEKDGYRHRGDDHWSDRCPADHPFCGEPFRPAGKFPGAAGVHDGIVNRADGRAYLCRRACPATHSGDASHPLRPPCGGDDRFVGNAEGLVAMDRRQTQCWRVWQSDLILNFPNGLPAFPFSVALTNLTFGKCGARP